MGSIPLRFFYCQVFRKDKNISPNCWTCFALLKLAGGVSEVRVITPPRAGLSVFLE